MVIAAVFRAAIRAWAGMLIQSLRLRTADDKCAARC